MSNVTFQLINNADKKTITELVRLQQEVFPPHIQISDPADYYRDALNDPMCINAGIYNEAKEVVGYLMALPLGNTFEELSPWDPELTNKANCAYIDIYQVLPEYRGSKNALSLIKMGCNEALSRGMSTVSMHARMETGLNRYLRRIFKKVHSSRTIDNWFGFVEPFEFLEVENAFRS